jgi:tRNA(Ser,Leu) C12 N-acetylase TAN1
MGVWEADMTTRRVQKLADWNVLVTLPENTFHEARRILTRWGRIEPTGYYNVLVMHVVDPNAFLADFASAVAATPGLLNFVSHVVPAQRSFSFDSSEAFDREARAGALGRLSDLAGASFYVRLHRRGSKGIISTQPEERFLDEVLLNALADAGTPGRIGFSDPDKVIQIETVDGRAGMSLWTREDLRRFPFLGVD